MSVGIPVVIKAAGGLPVSVSTNGYGLPCTISTNGMGLAVTQATGGGGLAVTGMTFGPDVTAPIITSTNTVSNAENTVLAHTLTANEPVTWAIVAGGADNARFQLTGNTLQWLSNGTKDFEAPNDANVDNAYIVTVRATDLASNPSTTQTITVTVTNVTGIAPAAPVLVLLTDATDTTPDFTLTGDLVLADTVRFQYATAADFTGTSELTNTIDAGEDAANAISFSTGVLAGGTWYFRARIERPDAGNSAWSNVETITYASSEDAATTAWVNAVVAAGGTVSTTQRGRVNTLIAGLKTDGLFAKLDALWVHAGESVSQQALIDIVGLHAGTAVGSPGLNASGYIGNGSSAYINTGFSSFTKLASANASLGIYCTAVSTAADATATMGMENGTVYCDILPKYDATTTFSRLNSFPGDLISAANTNRQGFYVVTRDAADSQKAYRNGNTTPVGSNTTTEKAVPALAFYLLATNSSGIASGFTTADRVGASFIGSGMTATQQANMSARINAYMTAWGINVY
jgi:hypothetical protein